MEVEYDLLPEDVIAFNRYHTRRTTAPHLHTWVLGFLATSGMLVVGVIIARGLFKGVWLANVATLSSIAVVSILLFAVLLYSRSLTWKQAHQVAKEGGSQRLELRPEGIEYSALQGAGIIVWTAIKRIAVTEDYAFFYISDANAFAVPKRAFRDEAGFREFVTTAERFHRQAIAGAES